MTKSVNHRYLQINMTEEGFYSNSMFQFDSKIETRNIIFDNYALCKFKVSGKLGYYYVISSWLILVVKLYE